MIELVIVGGGSAGWITAVFADAILNGTAKRKKVAITVVESARVGRIGVGEATVPTLISTLRDMGIAESDFLAAADATFKLGIRFEGWKAEPGHGYYHVFDRHPGGPRDFFGLRWLASDGAMPFAHYVSAQAEACDRHLAPRDKAGKDYTGAFVYAYHMDAEKFAGLLVETGKARGIRHVVDDVVSVEAEGETISSITLAGGDTVSGTLFVDCTGFARVLSSAIGNTKFADLSEWLICDRAVAIQVPYDGVPETLLPYTRSVALSSGWMWDIGLQTRRGTGYVYCSRHIGDDAAEAELRAHNGAPADCPARRLRFDVGHLQTPWKGNCVAIGLAGGFVEPMESTGIYMIEYAARMLCELLPLFGKGDLCAQRFNSLLADRYGEVLDFVNLHYVLSDRKDTPFWRDATDAARITPRLQEWLAIWEQKPPSPSDFANSHQLFGYQNYEYCLYGLDWKPKALSQMQSTPIQPHRGVQRKAAMLADALADHRDFFFGADTTAP